VPAYNGLLATFLIFFLKIERLSACVTKGRYWVTHTDPTWIMLLGPKLVDRLRPNLIP
jgi:hypothetical protein